jgi:N-acetyl-1-D-myo-inositol-2-amino-2-deoxy-alpha-D-glucopyranoside deacetylase
VRLLVTVAHPDDEAFGCGSVLAHARARGVEAHVVCATRGELGEPTPGTVIGDGGLGAIREAEVRAATALLGVARTDVLDWCDSGVDGSPAPGSLAAAPFENVVREVRMRIDELAPDVVVTLDASDGHRDHAVIRDATLAAIRRVANPPARTYLWCLPRSLLAPFLGAADAGTPDDDITTIVDVRARLDERWAAMRAHASQKPPYEMMPPDLADAFLATDRLRRVEPPWRGGERETDWA